MHRAPMMWVMLALAACGPERPPWAEGRTVTTIQRPGAAPQQLANVEGRLLALHNRERAGIGVPPLRWDPALAAAAAPYAATLAQRGRLAHSPPDARPGQGENLWMGTRGAYQVEEMIGHWAAERRLFRPGIFPNVSSSGHWADVAHYTQMIWPGTGRLGCALRRSPASDVLVCRYAPPGNVVGQRVP
jgi:hypothetical protein